MPFIDTLVMPEPGKTLNATVLRKHSHTGQYLQWYSNHSIAAKHSVINSLTHIAKTVCSHPQVLHKEENYLGQTLQKCKYPNLVLNRIIIKSNIQKKPSNSNTNENLDQQKRKIQTKWSHTQKDSVNVSRAPAANMGYRNRFKVFNTIKHSWYIPRAEVSSSRKVG